MGSGEGRTATAASLVEALRSYIDETVRITGSTEAVRPGHRVKFHWPPHPVSYEFHISPTAWSERAHFEAYGDTFAVEVARSSHGVFGRSPELWHEDRGDTVEEMLSNLRASAEPLFARQLAINRTLNRKGRFKGHVRELPPEDLIKLLYCEDRDVANEGRIELETHASSRLFTDALIEVLRDKRHPHRRIAQWCALDLFEDLPSFCPDEASRSEAVRAIEAFLWDAEDDYARAAFKAGVVLGGHVPGDQGEIALLRCLDAPSRYGSRSAIHGLFHVVEWRPDRRADVVAALRTHGEREGDEQLSKFALRLADDIESGAFDHVAEPVFPEEG
ncbi:MAG: hypothetical protein HY248_03200 [Fimbriimonas ginsengisoli]|uniref:Uncharacterized protein n=1 Tax=Fimbriimonas ginsengisoli TaxID=1005039 RepID=A0A931LZB7_FIMGI|nr:hypothetical protein [Fimbriimonas ginsengisoli]MBI3721536.1 hypothetical protein [Fimbriimonas ginsengisoli]